MSSGYNVLTQTHSTARDIPQAPNAKRRLQDSSNHRRVIPDRSGHAQRRWSGASKVFHFSLFFFVLSVFLHIISCQTTLNLIITPSASFIAEQRQANVTCSVSTSATPASGSPLTWSRNGGLPDSASVVDLSPQPGNGGTTLYESILYFTPTALDNEIEIVCTANFNNAIGSQSYTPNVMLVPKDPVITGPSEVDANVNTTWTCVAEGASRIAPNVYWRDRNGRSLLNDVTKATTYNRVPNNNNVFAVTTTVSLPLPGDAALYRLSCTIVHSFQDYTVIKITTTVITVYFPPVIDKTGSNIIYTDEGLSPVLSCFIVVSSPPATSVSWSKDNQPLDLLSGRYGPVSVNSANLTILSAVRADRGDYVCTASNSKGSTSFTVPTTLIVRYPPTINNTGNGTTHEGSAGGSLTIECPVDAVPPPADVTWKRILNGQVITLTLGNGQRYKGGTAAQNYALIIDPVQAGDAGTYFCVAANDLGNATGPNNTVIVNFNPVVNVQKDVTVLEGRNFTISCTIIMYPAVTSVTWLKGNVRLTIGGSTGRYSGATVQNPSLAVTNALKADSGVYTCQGSNGTYSVSGEAFVTVTYFPLVKVPTDNITRNARQTVTMYCIYDAVPAPYSLFWQKQSFSGSGVPVNITADGRFSGGDLSSPNLTIANLEAEDMTTYYCIVENSVGKTTSRPVYLIVQYEPRVTAISSPSVVDLGKPFTLTCTVDAYPPVIEFSWSNGSVKVASSSTYSVAEAARWDFAVFTCAARNPVGTGYDTVKPNIIFAPYLVGSGNDDIVAPFGSIVDLVCKVSGNPEPSFSWYHGGEISVGNSSVFITVNLSSQDAFGVYTCAAANSAGSLNPAWNFTITEGEPPVAGGPKDDSSLSTASIILIVIIIIIFIIIVILLITFCCAQGACCSGKKDRSKVGPTAPVTARSLNGRLALSPIPNEPLDKVDSKPVYIAPNETISIDDDSLSPFPSSRSRLPPIDFHGGSIISVPERSGPRAHHLPPLDSEAESAAIAREDENRRSQRKKHKNPKDEDRSALTGIEERTEGSSSTA